MLDLENPIDAKITAKGLQYVAGRPATPDEAAVELAAEPEVLEIHNIIQR